MSLTRAMRRFLPLVCILAAFLARVASGQSISVPWSDLGHGPQHTGLSQFPANTMSRIEWQAPVDLDPQYSGNDLYIHYGSPVVTQSNTVIIPVKTGAQGGFRVEGHSATSGSLVWTQTTDYILPAHDWTPSCGICLTPRNRLYFPGAGGTVYYRDVPDAAVSTGTGQIAFYGISHYLAAESTYQDNVQIDTPLTSDRYGDIFFGFTVSGSNPLGLQSGIARIDSSGAGTWVAASTAPGDPNIVEVVMNCAPALSNDQKTLYIAVSYGSFQGGYLVALDSRTLAPVAHVLLKDLIYTASDALLADEGSASPTIGPDGDVYFGVLENPFLSNHDRGWMLHFNGALSMEKTPGAFGWDDTCSIVPSSAVPSYTGTSSYLILTKYNNYADPGVGGNGINKVAILDPNATEIDPISGATVMNEVITVVGVTPDAALLSYSPNAVMEWCINSAAVDPSTKSAIINSEDGKVYRWDFTTNSLTQSVVLTPGIGEAYTPSIIGPNGMVYVINNATVFAVGP
ncbi:MAG TPA: hypothetical protein VHY22_00880 [Chthoniobacteraceae bacterium]|jgi:hypothetical protein|nr:hypothetical protein [Chthoniobacteraceae bacterium]